MSTLTTQNSRIKWSLLTVIGFIVLLSLNMLYKHYGTTSDQLPSLSFHPHFHPSTSSSRKANATMLMLARNNELEGAVSSIRQLEDRFNRKYNYPWVFLNDEPFTEEFKRRTSVLTNANVTYGVIPREHWVQPDWIDEERAAATRKQLEAERVPYGGSLSYRNMCRFNSGYFYRHELLKNFRYYWRVEPNVRYYCDIDYDPFLFMQDEHKSYGFTMTLYEHASTVKTLWDTAKEFLNQNPQKIHPDNALGFLSEDSGNSWNQCHFWSNFEIADMDVWRSDLYTEYFEHLDRTGGFYYERWGDAPVHSFAAALFLPKDKIHFFSDIGYKHSIYEHCPQGKLYEQGKCWCDPKENFDYTGFSCLSRWERLF